MMTPPPCKDCQRMYVGCKAFCEDWAMWQITHALEKAEIEKKRKAKWDVDRFLIGRSRRTMLVKQEQKRKG